MRLIIFLLLAISVHSEPTAECKNNPVNCVSSDFDYDTSVSQCLYTNYDRRFAPWDTAIDGQFRKECNFIFSCEVVHRDKNVVQYARSITVGNNRNQASVVKQEAQVYDGVAADIRAKANKYYNRDQCVIKAWPGVVWISGFGIIALALLGLFIWWLVKKCNDANELEEEESLGLIKPAPASYQYRKRRIF